MDKIDAGTHFFDAVLGGLGGRAKTFIPSVKLLMANKLGQSLSLNRLMDFTPLEMLELLGFDKIQSDRTLYRTLERLGEQRSLVIEKYQKWVQTQNLVDKHQMIDFSSSYFEGKKCPLGKLGYSRDGQPGKLQFTFGVGVGMNGIPSMLTIQKGNVQDKKHMRYAIRLSSNVLEEGSLLTFDCGGNTKDNKERIRKNGLHYLTLKAKKRGPYRIAIAYFMNGKSVRIISGGREYLCVKSKEDDETRYIFFSQALKDDQLRKKADKFRKALEKGQDMQKKVEKGKELGQQICSQGWIMLRGELQKIFGKQTNPFITGLEGYFILESSIDEDPALILEAYKNRDKAEKLIRDLKEGAELRPVRHWSKEAVLGFVLVVFLTKALIAVTQVLCKEPLVQNLKVLKKYMNHLTLTVLYPKNGFKIAVISNFSAEMKALLGDSIKKYGDLGPNFGW